MANSLKSISGTSEMRPLGANDHVISSKIDLGGNIMEFSLTVRGMMSLLTTLLGATNEFYYWLGFSTALEFQQYMDSLYATEPPKKTTLDLTSVDQSTVMLCFAAFLFGFVVSKLTMQPIILKQ